MKLKYLMLVLALFAVEAKSDSSKTKPAKVKKTFKFDGNKYKKSKPKFKCDGRQYCSQMNSFEEAKFFLKNCPNTKMDGDNDGIPCERQFKKG